MDLLDLFNVLFVFSMGALTVLACQWILEPKKFKELMKAMKTFKKKS